MYLRNNSFLILLFCFAVACKSQQQTERLLFIGNSHTYYNDMPKIVEQLAKNNNKRIVCDMITQDGYTLSEHAADAKTISKIKTGSYSKVILQENSLAVLFWPDSIYHKGVELLHKTISSTGAKTYLLQNWANQFADSVPLARFGKGFYYDRFKSYNEAQEQLEQKVNAAAAKFKIEVIPTGKVWSAVVRKYPELDLWTDEWGHPDKTGSIIVAGVVYEFFMKERINWSLLFEEQKVKSINGMDSIVRNCLINNLNKN